MTPISKVPINDLAAGFRSSNRLNTNFQTISTAFDNTLSRDGTGPNQMDADLDMNSNPVINVGAPRGANDAVRVVDLEAYTRQPITYYIEDFGGIALTTELAGTLNTAAVQLAWAAGIIPTLKAGQTYAMRPLSVTSDNVGIYGERGSVLYFLKSSLTNMDTAVTTGPTAVAITCSGFNDIILSGFKIDFEVQDGRCLRGIRAIGCVNLVIDNIEICNMGIGRGIDVGSITGNSRISNFYIHDFTASIDLGAASQITAIVVDDDRVSGGSDGLIIRDGQISNMTMSGAVLAAVGYQTDGINIGHYSNRRTHISNVTIVEVDEGIDSFSWLSVFENITVKNARGFGIKFVHGASYNSVTDFTVENYGYAGVVLAGSSIVGDPHLQFNVITNGTITGGDYQGVWGPLVTTAALTFINPPPMSGVSFVRNNLISNLLLDPTGAAEYSFRDEGNGLNNRVTNCIDYVAGSLGRVLCDDAASTVYVPANKTVVVASLTNAQSVTPASPQKILFNNEEIDLRSEYDPATTRWTCTASGYYRVKAVLRYAVITSGKTMQVRILINGSTTKALYLQNFTGTSDASLSIERVIFCKLGDYVEIYTENGDIVSRDLTNNSQITYMQIEHAL